MAYNFDRVCLSVCQTITLESLDVGSSYLHIRYISREYRSSSYMKVTGWRSRSQEQRNRKSLHPQCQTSIGNPDSIKHSSYHGVFGNGGLSAWCDRHLCHVTRKWQRVTKCTHLRVVGLRLESNLVYINNFGIISASIHELNDSSNFTTLWRMRAANVERGTLVVDLAILRRLINCRNNSNHNHKIL